MEIIISAILFYFIGRFSKTTEIEDTTQKAIKIVKEKFTKKKILEPGPIPFKTPEDFEYEKSGGKALDDHWFKSGIMKEFKNE